MEVNDRTFNDNIFHNSEAESCHSQLNQASSEMIPMEGSECSFIVNSYWCQEENVSNVSCHFSSSFNISELVMKNTSSCMMILQRGTYRVQVDFATLQV